MQDRYNSDFEKFLKQNADQYRMFPSEKVWKGIHSSLHTRKWWYGLGILLLFITSGVVTGVMFLTPSQHKSLTETGNTKPSEIINPVLTKDKKKESEKHEKIIIVPAKNTGDPKNNSLINSEYLIGEKRFLNNDEVDANVVSALTPPALVEQFISSATIPTTNFIAPVNKKIDHPVNTIPTAFESLKLPLVQQAPDPALMKVQTEFLNNSEASLNTDKKPASEEKRSEEYKEIYPLTIESVVNTYKKITHRKKTTWQFYLMPTVSYRKLKENMNFVRAARANGTFAPNVLISYENVNTVVNHKPDLGFELGFNAGFRVTDNFKFITGLQFNVSKYDIRAFNYQNELAIIALNNSNRSTVTAVTPYRSFGNTNKSDWLHNLYISISAPTGIEATFKSKRKVYGGFAATLQPTYNLVNQAYLLSTDFKNYAEVPSLTRKWNLNTSFEIFAGIPSKKLDWRIGPQVRYQALSSFRDDYPLREHLFDFGLKMGILLK